MNTLRIWKEIIEVSSFYSKKKMHGKYACTYNAKIIIEVIEWPFKILQIIN